MITCCERNEFGVWTPCAFHEKAAEFNGEVPNWEKRLDEFDGYETGTLILESDFATPDREEALVADWDIFYEITGGYENV